MLPLIGSELWDSFLVKVVASIIAPVLVAIAYFLCRKVYAAFQALQLAREALEAVDLRQEHEVSTEGPGFWLRPPKVDARPTNYDALKGTSIPILMIAATKGGVGKTSLAGSLAAHFAMCWTQRRQNSNQDMPLRVLVIDQDFQASFTLMTVHENHRPGAAVGGGVQSVQRCASNRLVSGELGKGGVQREARPVSQTGMASPLSIWTIPSNYDLAQAENRMMIRWLLPLSDAKLVDWLLHTLRIRSKEGSSTTDLRYLLAAALLDPQVQASFDLIIIDSPPRLTTSHIQAMCASTHLLIPTVLDALSGDAVFRYLDQIATHKLGPPGDGRRAICPHLQPIGVVCTLLPNTTANLDGRLNVLRARIAAGRLQPDIVPKDCFIRQRAPYRDHAGERLAYAASSGDQQHEDLREEVDRLGDWLAPKLGAPARGWSRIP